MKTTFLLAGIATSTKATDLLFIMFLITVSILVIVVIFLVIKKVDKKVQKNVSEPKNHREGYKTEEKPHFVLNEPLNLPAGCIKCNDFNVVESLHKMYLKEMEFRATVHVVKGNIPELIIDIIHSPDIKDAWDYCYLIKVKNGNILIFRSLDKKRTVPPVVYIQGDVHIEQVRNVVEKFCHKVLDSIDHAFK